MITNEGHISKIYALRNIPQDIYDNKIESCRKRRPRTVSLNLAVKQSTGPKESNSQNKNDILDQKIIYKLPNELLQLQSTKDKLPRVIGGRTRRPRSENLDLQGFRENSFKDELVVEIGNSSGKFRTKLVHLDVPPQQKALHFATLFDIEFKEGKCPEVQTICDPTSTEDIVEKDNYIIEEYQLIKNDQTTSRDQRYETSNSSSFHCCDDDDPALSRIRPIEIINKTEEEIAQDIIKKVDKEIKSWTQGDIQVPENPGIYLSEKYLIDILGPLNPTPFINYVRKIIAQKISKTEMITCSPQQQDHPQKNELSDHSQRKRDSEDKLSKFENDFGKELKSAQTRSRLKLGLKSPTKAARKTLQRVRGKSPEKRVQGIMNEILRSEENNNNGVSDVDSRDVFSLKDKLTSLSEIPETASSNVLASVVSPTWRNWRADLEIERHSGKSNRFLDDMNTQGNEREESYKEDISKRYHSDIIVNKVKLETVMKMPQPVRELPEY